MMSISNLDAIFIPSGGTVRAKDGSYHSTTYEDGDAFGVLGGCARVEAAAMLSHIYPNAVIVPQGAYIEGAPSISHAHVAEQELVGLGVSQLRIIREEHSVSTKTGLVQANKLAQDKGWTHILFVTNQYHVPRLTCMWDMLKSSVDATVVGAEEIIMEGRPEFKKEFETITRTPTYIKRLSSEARGLTAFCEGKYTPASSDDKKERLV